MQKVSPNENHYLHTDNVHVILTEKSIKIIQTSRPQIDSRELFATEIPIDDLREVLSDLFPKEASKPKSSKPKAKKATAKTDK